MSAAPERPQAVPAGAVWLEEAELWETALKDGAGKRQGEARLFRPDGTLYRVSRFVDGLEEGPFTIYHPNGETARRGECIAGDIHGEVRAFASTAPTSEHLRACCVPQGAWEMRAKFDHGRLLGERFFDNQGRGLLSDGSIRPDRPAGVPEDAEFEEFSRRWCAGRYDTEAWEPAGTWRYFDEAGRLDEATDYENGKKVRSRFFDAAGEVRLELHFAADGKRDGAYRRRFVEPSDSPYADARIVEERGAYASDQPVGGWTLLDAAGAVVATLERGGALFEPDVAASPALANEDRSPEGWTALASGLRAAGRVREGLVAAARALGAGGDADDFRRFLAGAAAPLTDEESGRWLQEVANASEDTMSRALVALVLGADAALLLRTLAASVKGSVRAARDLAEASVRLAPERAMTYLTRALVRIELGDVEGALADAARVDAESAETAQFVRDYARLLFPAAWDFWPARETPNGPVENMPDEPGQPLDQIRRTIQVYATRLRALRDAVVRWLPAGSSPPSWLPPALEDVLPDGPAELRREAATITDDTDEGPETVEVQIDEVLEPDGATVPSLMRAARAQWAALTWLCWAAGLDRVGLPKRLKPPPDFPAATSMAIARYFRVQDVLLTNGLRSLTAGVPGFSWEGSDVDALPRPFAEVAVDEYFELRALFLWLASPENLSPFQSDLRQV